MATDRARDLYRRSLTIAEELAGREPANTEYQRDLSFSYERLAEASATDQPADAKQHIDAAAAARNVLQQREPENVELTEELAATLGQRIAITEQAEPDRSAILALLEPLEQQGRLTPKGAATLGWLRHLDNQNPEI